MANRVSEDDVREIIEVSSTLILDAFITSANVFITATLGTTLSEGLLKEIERWMSAHFVAIREKRANSVKIGDAEETYSVKVGMGLKATQYGQQAILLDTTGVLDKLGERKKTYSMTILNPFDTE